MSPELRDVQSDSQAALDNGREISPDAEPSCSSVISESESESSVPCGADSGGHKPSPIEPDEDEQKGYDSDDEDERALCIDEDFVSNDESADSSSSPPPIVHQPVPSRAYVKPDTLSFIQHSLRSSESPPCSDEGYLSATPLSSDDLKQLPFSNFLKSHTEKDSNPANEGESSAMSVKTNIDGPSPDVVETVLLDSKEGLSDSGDDAVHVMLEIVESNVFADDCFTLEFPETPSEGLGQVVGETELEERAGSELDEESLSDERLKDSTPVEPEMLSSGDPVPLSPQSAVEDDQGEKVSDTCTFRAAPLGDVVSPSTACLNVKNDTPTDVKVSSHRSVGILSPIIITAACLAWNRKPKKIP